MFQPIQIETQSEQQGLTHLRAQRSTRCAGREFSFHRGEQALDQGAAAVNPLRESPPHFGTHSVHAPGFLSAFGGDHALRSESLADVSMIALAVELRVGQHQPDVGCWEAASTTAGKFAQSFHGPRRASCDNTNC